MIEDYFDIWKGKGQTQGTGLQPDSSPFKPSKELVGVFGGELNQRYVRMLPSNSILYSRAWPGLGIAEGGRAKEHHHSQLCGAACHRHLSWYCCPDCRPRQPLTKETDRWRKKNPTLMLLPNHWDFLYRFNVIKVHASPSSSGKYLLSIASLIWLFAPFGSRSIAQLKFIKAKWVWPNFLYTWRVHAIRVASIRKTQTLGPKGGGTKIKIRI